MGLGDRSAPQRATGAWNGRGMRIRTLAALAATQVSPPRGRGGENLAACPRMPSDTGRWGVGTARRPMEPSTLRVIQGFAKVTVGLSCAIQADDIDKSHVASPANVVRDHEANPFAGERLAVLDHRQQPWLVLEARIELA